MLETCLVLHRRLGNQVEIAATLSTLALARLQAGDAAGAEASEREALELFRALGQKHGEAIGLLHLGQIAVYVGDTERDVGAGRHAGVVTVGVATGPLSYEDLHRAGAHRVYESLPDAPTFLREVLGCAI